MSVKPATFPLTSRGITYSLESQTENARIVRCQFETSEDWFEVSERKIGSAFTGPGNPRQLYEMLPSDEAFGKWAWTTRNLAEAVRIHAELHARVDARKIPAS